MFPSDKRLTAIKHVWKVLLAVALVSSVTIGSSSPADAAAVIRVPQDHTTIGEAIDAADPGDEILVGPGTYYEGIDVSDKSVTVRSELGAAVTILNRPANLGDGSALIGFGFDIEISTGLLPIQAIGDGILISENAFVGQDAQNKQVIHADGDGIIVNRNILKDITRCSLGIWASGDVLVTNNVLVNLDCAGIVVSAAAASTAAVINNTVVGGPSRGIDARGPFTIRNNIVASVDTGLWADGTTTIENNLLFGNVVDYLDVADQTSSNGNISADPVLDATSGFRLATGSPAIDAGSETEAPTLDYHGTTRPIDGDGAGGAASDIGAHEFAEPFGHIAGVVRNEAAAGLRAICVLVWDGPEVVGASPTEPSGAYEISVPAASYTVSFEDCVSGVFTTVWYDGAPNRGGAADVIVTSDATLGNINAVLTTAARCRGLIPTMMGGPGRDELDGTAGDDVFYSVGGDDSVRLEEGDDVACVQSGSATIYGGPGDDEIVGGPDDDRLFGGSGRDLLNGRGGNDELVGNEGADILLGGPGADELNGLTGADSLDGQGGDDFLSGGSGNDVLKGGLGSDVLSPELGDDEIDGGAGSDTAWFGRTPAAVVVNLPAGTVTGQGSDTIVGVENVDGSNFDDVIVGDGGPNTLKGDGGADEIRGGGGDDRMFGGPGDDTLAPGAGDDFVSGKSGRDTIDFSGAQSGVVVDLTAATASGQGIDVVQLIANVIGSNSDDIISGSKAPNVIRGRGGNDDISGNDDDDILSGGPGKDSINGGRGFDDIRGDAGNDTLSGGDDGDILVGGAGKDTLRGGAGPDVIHGGKGGDTIDGGLGNDDVDGGLQNDVVDGGTGSDFIAGANGNDTLDGGPGDDLIIGGFGKDVLRGSDGNDTLVGSQGDDALSGGPGIDTASYFLAPRGVTVDLASGSSSGGDGADTLSAIEQIVGSPYDDLLSGDANDNLIEARTGDDILDGRGGEDLVSFGFSALGVTADMQAGTATGEGDDSFLSFEWLLATDQDDAIIGSVGADVILVEGGDDLVLAGSGDDIVLGGDGSDELRGQAGDDALDGEGGSDTIVGGAGVDTCIGEIISGCESPDVGDLIDGRKATSELRVILAARLVYRSADIRWPARLRWAM